MLEYLTECISVRSLISFEARPDQHAASTGFGDGGYPATQPGRVQGLTTEKVRHTNHASRLCLRGEMHGWERIGAHPAHPPKRGGRLLSAINDCDRGASESHQTNEQVYTKSDCRCRQTPIRYQK